MIKTEKGRIAVSGGKPEMLADLSVIAHTLVENYNVTEGEILKSIAIGVSTEESISESMKKDAKTALLAMALAGDKKSEMLLQLIKDL